MNPKDFDDILKDKLKNLDSSKLNRPDWDRMERAIDEDSLKDQAFDEQVKRKLEQISLPAFVPTNWDNLYELISQRIQRKNAILFSKAFELAIVALLFLTAINLGVWQEDRVPVKYALEEFSTPIELDVDKIQIAEANSLDNIENVELALNINTEVENNIAEENLSNPDNTDALITAHREKHLIQVVSNQNAINKRKENFTSLVDFKENPNITVSADSYLQTDYQNSLEHDLIAMNNNIQALELETNINAKLPIIQPVTFFKKPKWYVGASLNFNTNFIKSGLKESFARTRNPDEYDPLETLVNSTNYSIQAEVGYKKDRLAVSTGFEYQQIEYSPFIELTTGSLSSNLVETNVQSIKYDFFSVPLNISYDLLSAKGWTLDINSGISANALARSEQTINQNILKGSRTIEVPESDIDYSVLNYNFQEGILDEPSISTNRIWKSLFYRAKIGFGIQKNIGSNTSIFAQSSYNFQLPSFRKESSDFEIDDNIRSFSVGFGVRQFFG